MSLVEEGREATRSSGFHLDSCEVEKGGVGELQETCVGGGGDPRRDFEGLSDFACRSTTTALLWLGVDPTEKSSGSERCTSVA